MPLLPVSHPHRPPSSLAFADAELFGFRPPRAERRQPDLRPLHRAILFFLQPRLDWRAGRHNSQDRYSERRCFVTLLLGDRLHSSSGSRSVTDFLSPHRIILILIAVSRLLAMLLSSLCAPPCRSTTASRQSDSPSAKLMNADAQLVSQGRKRWLSAQGGTSQLQQ